MNAEGSEPGWGKLRVVLSGDVKIFSPELFRRQYVVEYFAKKIGRRIFSPKYLFEIFPP